MGFLRDLKEKYFPEKKDLEISWEQADETFRDEKSREIESAGERKQDLVEKTFDLTEDIKEGLEAFDEYDDTKDLQIVEDVAQNFYRTRKRLLEDFDPDEEDIEEHLDDLEDFLEEFNDVTRKEGEVMKYVGEDAPKFSEGIEELVTHREDVEEFIDTDYQRVIQLSMIEEYMADVKRLGKELEDAKESLEGKDTRDIKQDIEDLEDELDEIESTDQWQRKKALEREKEQLIEEKENKRKEIKSYISKIDRGLKKLVYNIENKGLEFEGSVRKLEKLKEREIDDLDDIMPELEKGLEKIEKKELLDDRDMDKFREGKEGLENFSELKNSISELEKEISDVEDDLDEISIEEEKKELKSKKETLETDLKEKKDSVRGLEEKRDEKLRKRQKKLIELEHFMNSLMHSNVTVREIKEERRG